MIRSSEKKNAEQRWCIRDIVRRKEKGEVVKRAGHEKLKTSRKPKRHKNGALNSTNQNVPHGHNAYGAATTH